MKKILLLLVFVSVFAQQSMAVDSRWYVGLGAGQSSLDLSALGTMGAVSVDDTDTAFKVFAGYEINKYIAIEGFYLNAGEMSISGDAGTGIFADGEMVIFPADTKMGIDLKSYGVVGVLGYPVNQYFNPYVKLGLQNWETKVSVSMGDIKLSESDDGTGAAYGAGFRVDLTHNVSMRAEFERYIFDGDDVDVSSAGIMYRF